MNEQNIGFQPSEWQGSAAIRQSYLSVLVEDAIAKNPHRRRIGNEQFAEQFGMEGFDFKLAGMISDSFGRVFSSGVFSNLRHTLSGLFEPGRTRSVLPPLQSSLKLWLGRQNYIALSDVTVYVPKGLRVTYLDYLTALEKASETILRILPAMIEPTIEYVGILINNPSYVRSVSGIGTPATVAELNNVNVESVTEPIAACFDPSNNSDETKYGNVLQRNSDLEVVHRRTVALQEAVAASRPTEVEKRIAVLIDMCEKLADAVRAHPDYKAITTVISKEVAGRIYACAQWAELYAVYLRQVMVLENAIADTTKKLAKVSKI